MIQSYENLARWDQLQEPACRSSYSTSYLRLMAALDTGWDIYEIIGVNSSQLPDEEDMVCFNLYKPASLERRNLFLPQSRDLSQFIRNENLTYRQEIQNVAL